MSKQAVARYCIALATMLVCQSAPATNTTTTPQPTISNYTRPLSFEPNRGQTDKQVDFLAHGAGYRLFLSHGEAVMAMDRGITVRMRLVGAKPSSPEPLQEQPSRSNYFIGNDPERWQTNLPNYAKVRYRNVYRGIDAIYYGNQRQLEYDFVVRPGADPNRILLQFHGGMKPTLDRSGCLVMHTAAGDLRWHKPVAYQEVNGNRKLVACDYVRKRRGELSFGLGAFDKSKPLIIDPILQYSTYLGGSGSDQGSGIAFDSKGNSYVTGRTGSPDFPKKNAYQETLTAPQTAFVVKFNADGEPVYSSYLGGSGQSGCATNSALCDAGISIAVDRDGNAYVTGFTDSADFPTKNAFQSQNNVICRACGPTAFVTKLDATGCGLIFSTYLGGSGGEFANGIAVDTKGHAYVTGETASRDFPIKNAFQPVYGGSVVDAFVTKFDPSGKHLVYSTFLGGSGSDVGSGIAVDTRDDAYVIGFTLSSDFPTSNAFQNSPGGGTSFGDAFVAKFNAAGNELVYSTYLGGSDYDQGFGIAVDADDSAYVTGWTFSTDFPVKNALQENLRSSTGGNAFVAKFDATGTALFFSTYLEGVGVSLAMA
jgi:hypothetical protein